MGYIGVVVYNVTPTGKVRISIIKRINMRVPQVKITLRIDNEIGKSLNKTKNKCISFNTYK